jgi:hypothetical protein
MDVVLALLLVLVAWVVFKSLVAVILVAVAVSLVVWILRQSRNL